MSYSMKEYLTGELNSIREDGLYKSERILTGPQGSKIFVKGGEKVINMCANNYLGLSSHPEIVAAAKESLDQWGFGLSSVRFICGTQDVHRRLEQKISDFLGMEDTILYSSCFDANGGLFETLLGAEDAIISDELNHASIIDGVRLSKAKRFRYKNSNMEDLKEQLISAANCRYKLIVTDGVFSMDGHIADLKGVCDLADEYNAMVMVDDSHAVGFMGSTGRGTHQHCDVMGRVDIITGTLGKALGGASGGYTSAKKEIVELLRQRSRPYLFSNTLAPAIATASIKALNLIINSPEILAKLKENTAYFRQEITKLGLTVLDGTHPIVPVMLGDATLASSMADLLLQKGIYVIGFSYPVVPKGKARIRTQISAAHTREDLDFAIKMFSEAKEELGL
ncbi:MAG: glycine C-acetyltransferase [Bdellovibrionales bacterium]|jgi:glycine C-acetyltransferase|nr:glycine C-acetyltransferase [Bdellovibrionales bacterium]MBT3524929.1 glycine C-acetyltransferase [Bdellovibrionales bacterium]MBT7767446.1 glycine C-acetyltransferase [Bdellovibrionales bacterium]